jgi:cytochrome c oxidase cbb3-type subunit 2
VALVTYPSAPDHGDLPARWRAGLLYGIAGWIGSGLGVGMAQDLHRIPSAFIVATGVVLLAACLVPPRQAVSRVARLYGVALIVGALGALPVLRGASSQARVRPGGGADTREAAIERGRRVYVAEGCIHCHSQYVRPAARDEAWWGPFVPEVRDKPLIGNRRQGPDLLNVGNRRSGSWHALHLRDPRALSPGSRMPSYAHLFEPGDSRGPDLVAYLASRGERTVDGRERLTRGAALHESPALPPSAARGEGLFRSYCAPCHGLAAYGDGPLASSIGGPAMNLHKGRLWFVSDEMALARVVRYGLPQTSMPGHEYLSDQQVADLVAFVGDLK